MGYPGGKEGGGAYQRIINEIPAHRVYIEAFCGGAAVFRHLRAAAETVLIDLAASAVTAALDVRSAGVVGVCADARSWLSRRKWVGDEFVYCDPPYLASARAGGARRIYRHELRTDAEHRRLLKCLRGIPVPVAVSGYWSELYAVELRDWRAVSWPARTRGGSAVEWLWMNYPEPVELHDYRYLGDDRRRRQDFRRQVCRWRRRLEEMAPLKRQALAAAVAAAVPSGAGRLLPGR